MEFPPSPEMLVIMYGIPYRSVVRDFINNKAQTLFKFRLIHQIISSLKHNVSISSPSTCSTDWYILETRWHDTEPSTHNPNCPVQLKNLCNSSSRSLASLPGTQYKEKCFMSHSQSLLCNNVTTVFYFEGFYTKMDNKLTKQVFWSDFCTFNMDSI